jgi:hypothetical protein
VLAETSVFFREAVDLTRNPGLQQHILVLSNFGDNFRGVFLVPGEMSWYVGYYYNIVFIYFQNRDAKFCDE